MKRGSVLLAAIVLALLSACGSSSSKSSGSAASASTSVVCSDYQALKDSLGNLTNIKVLSAGPNGVKAAADDVDAKASALASSSQQFAPQVDALKTAVSQLTSTLSGVPSAGFQGALSTLGPQISAVGKAGQNLQTAIGSTCPAAQSS